MFYEVVRAKQSDHPVDFLQNCLGIQETLSAPSDHELKQHQSIIEQLVVKRYTDEDNNFIKITE